MPKPALQPRCVGVVFEGLAVDGKRGVIGYIARRAPAHRATGRLNPSSSLHHTLITNQTRVGGGAVQLVPLRLGPVRRRLRARYVRSSFSLSFSLRNTKWMPYVVCILLRIRLIISISTPPLRFNTCCRAEHRGRGMGHLDDGLDVGRGGDQGPPDSVQEFGQ